MLLRKIHRAAAVASGRTRDGSWGAAAAAGASWPWVVLETRESLLSRTARRAGETKLGEAVAAGAQLAGKSAAAGEDSDGACRGPRYGVLGVPEDIGPVANLGRPGARGAWTAFLDAFANMQSNGAQFDASSVCVIGAVDTADLQAEADRAREEHSLAGGASWAPPPWAPRLRELVAELDVRVEAAAAEAMRRGLEVVVVGGGHNSSLPLAAAAAERYDSPVGLANLDPHADVRSTSEGRHSGNGFSAALERGHASHYCLLGYHAQYNSADTLATLTRLAADGGRGLAVPFESWLDLGGDAFGDSLADAAAFLDASTCAHVGLELDLDAVAHMPSSAASPTGVSLEQARRYVRALARRVRAPVRYLHIAEGAPSLGGADGERVVGRAIANLVCDFVTARESARSMPP